MKDEKKFRAWLSEKSENPDRESYNGFHVIQTFFQDPYSFYLKYVRGLKTVKTKPALIKGGIVHTAIEAGYRFRDKQAVLDTANWLFQVRGNEYAEQEQYHNDWREATAMLSAWADTWLDYDLANYHLLHIEESFELPLANGFIITVRPDLIVQAKSDGEIRALDHKTTAWNPMSAHNSLEDTDQSTTYIFALKKLYPNNTVLGVESDVLFKRSNMKEAKCTRVGIIQRSDWYLAEWELSTIAWLKDIARRIQMLDEGYPPAFAFPRGQSYWGSGDFPDIYRAPLPDDPTEPPFGYEIDEWSLDRAKAIATLKEE